IDKWDRECAAKLPPNFREIFARISDITQADAAVSALHRKLSELFEYVLDDARKLQLDWQVAFGVGDHRAVSLSSLRSRFVSWQANPEWLSMWINFRARWDRLAGEEL